MTVDILLPYYGDPQMMLDAVESILNQSDPAWRLVVLDDCEPNPRVGDHIKALAARDDRVHYERNDTNLGIQRTYRKILSHIENEYVMIMGSDDILQRTYLAAVKTGLAVHRDVDFVQSRVRIIDDFGRPRSALPDLVKGALMPRSSQDLVLDGERLARSIALGNWLYFPAITWRADVLRRHGLRKGFDVTQDLALAMDVIESGGRLLLLRDAHFMYRRHRASDSSVRALSGHRFAEERQLYQEFARRCEARGWSRAARASGWFPTSRLNALSLLPRAVKARQWAGAKKLWQHTATKPFGTAAVSDV